MKLSTARTAVYVCLGVAVLLAIPAALTAKPLFLGLMLAAVAAEIIIFFIYIRCPHCGRHLDITVMRDDTKLCPFCRKPLHPYAADHLSRR